MCGWIAKGDAKRRIENNSTFLRLSGYKYIDPLLVCDATDETDEKTELYSGKVKSLIDKNIQQGKIKQTSVYYRNFKTGKSFTVNPDEFYAPASLNKIPVRIAYYNMAKDNPDILQKKLTINLDSDQNTRQEIKPREFAKIGESYTIEYLIELMIKYSDNNAFFTMTDEIAKIDKKILESTYSDLKINIPQVLNENPDFITAKDFSYFLRVLYNGTYLEKDYSEKALELLTRTDFKDGLKAGIADETAIAHKFGLRSYFQGGKVAERELHDCGILYKKNSPYLLCVMTKEGGDLKEDSAVIRDISALVSGF